MGIKLIDKINAEQTAKLSEKKFPEFRAGDIVRVSIKIKLPVQQPLDPGDQGRQEGQRLAREALHRAHVLLA